MNNKNSRKSGIKRPSFVPADIRKEFGCHVKKPRLDVRLTPVSPHSPSKTHSSSNNVKDPADELWGEELTEAAIEECELLATQAYEEVFAARNENDNTIAANSKQDDEPRPSTSRDVSHGYFGGNDRFANKSSRFSLPVLNQKKDPTKFSSRTDDVKTSTSVNFVIPGQGSSFGGQQNKKNENEYKGLKEKCIQKEGENAILRSQLEQLRLQLEAQKLEHMKSLEGQAQKFTKQINEQKKELDVTNTQLQFQIMEATSMRNHCKVLESGSKIKLIEPKTVSKETPKKKKQTQREEEQRHASVSKSGIPSPGNKQFLVDKHRETFLKQIKPIGFRIREGAVLGSLVNEHLTAKSQPDISWIFYLRKKQSHCRKIKEAEGINSKILKLQKCTPTLESCYSAVNKLITLDVVNSAVAYFFVETIVKECQKIVCRQMHILHLLCSVQSYTERGSLNGVVASVIGTSASQKNCNLMSAGRWYDDEEGVESRRALGLLCALCEVSTLASAFIYGEKPLTSPTEEITTTISPPRQDIATSSKHLIPERINEKCENIATSSKHVIPERINEKCENIATSSKHIIPERINEKCENIATSSKHVIPEIINDKCENGEKNECTTTVQKKETIPYTEYITKPYGFLHLLRDIAFSISFQRRTRHFVGLLTGIVKLLNVVAKATTLVNEGVEVMKEIVREVIFCRPQLEVVIDLFELLASVANCSLIMKSLCINSDIKTFVDIKLIGLSYFTRESCVTQVLFRLLPTSSTSISLRTELCYYMVHWLHTFICFSERESCWLLAIQENKKVTCNCKDMLASGLVTTLYNSLCDLDDINIKNPTKLKVIISLKKGITLVRVWQQVDEEHWKYFAKESFAYQLWLAKMKSDMIKMELDELEKNCVLELLGKPEELNDVMEETEDQDEYWNAISNDCRVLFSDQK